MTDIDTTVRNTTTFDHLAGEKYVLLTTFRRDGTPVATPLWHAVRDGTTRASPSARARCADG